MCDGVRISKPFVEKPVPSFSLAIRRLTGYSDVDLLSMRYRTWSGLADYSQVDRPGVRYKFVNFEAGKSPGSSNRGVQINCDRARTFWTVVILSEFPSRVVISTQRGLRRDFQPISGQTNVTLFVGTPLSLRYCLP